MMKRIADVRRDFETERSRNNGVDSGSVAVGAELQRVHATLTELFETIQSVDARPTAAQESAITAALAAAEAAIAKTR
jgi:hypothetical protein